MSKTSKGGGVCLMNTSQDGYTEIDDGLQDVVHAIYVITYYHLTEEYWREYMAGGRPMSPAGWKPRQEITHLQTVIVPVADLSLYPPPGDDGGIFVRCNLPPQDKMLSPFTADTLREMMLRQNESS